MSTRAKRILSLLNKNECENSKHPTGENKSSEQKEEDPWIYFKQWQENSKKKAVPVQNFENKPESLVLKDLSNLNDALGKEKCSETIISGSSELGVTYSSESWKEVNEVGTDDDSSTKTSEKSTTKIIPMIKPIVLKQESKTAVVKSNFDLLETTSSIHENIQVEGNNESAEVSVEPERGQTTRVNTMSSYLERHSVEVSRRKGRVWDKKDRCPYCNVDMTNFSRHLFRKHSEEESVSKILKLPKGSSARKGLIDLLRKHGNFSVHSENIIRPVQRPASDASKIVSTEDFLPCKYCKGLYKKKSLSKHAKKCFFNKEAESGMRYSSEGQTILAFQESRTPFLNRLRLKTEVFNKMHADRISLNGKSDVIVCQYAEDYLRKHKRPHIKNLVSNKIRELGRLLIPLQDIYNIDSILEALKPQHFDKVVAAAKILAGYNEETKSFKAPSLALHFRTTLLGICSAAKTLLLKKDPALPVTNYEGVMKDIKNFRELVFSNWKFEMGSLALKDLNEKHSLKPQTLPLTQDIILFRDYCYKIADEAAESLKSNLNNLNSFQKLSEATLALTVLINRKRVGDVQYMKLESYNQPTVENNSEDCLNILTDIEKELTKNFKRILTVGKGSKPVPILFPKKIQYFVNFMLEIRTKTTAVPKENPFLFALVGSSSKWIEGSNTLRKYAVSCKAKNPATLTSSRLRKQIATVLQILNLSEVEMEQVATFMGHTRKTHEEFYRLPQEVFQTSKVAKLLLMVEKGICKDDQGKTLDEIDSQLQDWVNNDELLKETPEETYENESENEENINNPVDDISLPSTSRDVQRPLDSSRCRGSWTHKQKTVMLGFFKKHIKNKISPKKDECLRFKAKYLDLFEGKTWVQIKVFVYNTYRKQ